MAAFYLPINAENQERYSFVLQLEMWTDEDEGRSQVSNEEHTSEDWS